LAGHSDLLQWVHAERKGFSVKQANAILERAAQGGHKPLCRLAREWGAADLDRMFWSAASSGHESLCQLANGWDAAVPVAPKVTNALLCFRFIMANDLGNARETYGTEENLLEAGKDTTVQKRSKDKDTDPAPYWSAVGGALWRSVLSDEEKQRIRTQYRILQMYRPAD
jgi:hypothetical protein